MTIGVKLALLLLAIDCSFGHWNGHGRGCSSYDELMFPSRDGSCNNLGKRRCKGFSRPEMMKWGSAGSAHQRLLDPVYGDFFEGEPSLNDEPDVIQIARCNYNANARCSTRRSGRDLPNAREVTTRFHQMDPTPDDSSRTNMIAFFGQFIGHEISFSARNRQPDCCSAPVSMEKENCIPVRIPLDDVFFGPKNIQCLESARSDNKYDKDRGKIRQQFNEATSFIDASAVYGSGAQGEPGFEELVDFSTGKMMVRKVNGKEFPPNDDNGNPKCGDRRCGQVPGLFAMHTLFVREHNRIVGQMTTDMEPMMKFEKARRIVMAEIQNIVYDQFLPTILGKQVMRDFELTLPSRYNLYSNYERCTNPSSVNEFITAAMRFGHSTIARNVLEVNPANRNMRGKSTLHRVAFNNISIVEERGGNNLEWILQGGLVKKSKKNDQLIVDDVTNFLFAREANNFEFGSDLISRNILRGRDHGLPGYMRYRKACGQDVACRGWSDKPDNIPMTKWRVLQSLYEHPNDIDLFTGGTAEDPVQGGMVGQTFACIIGKQFRNSKFGDRFFFTHDNWYTGYDENQLMNLRQRTLRDVLCENTDIAEIPNNVFWATGRYNRLKSCNDVNKLNVRLLTKQNHHSHG